MGQVVNWKELRRLWEAATKGVFWQEEVAFSEACKVHLPAILDELEAAREGVREESNRWVDIIRGIDPEALCDFHDEHGSQEYLKAWLDARDRRQKLIGAAEELERWVVGPRSRRIPVGGAFEDGIEREKDAWLSELEQRAEKLRQEAEDGK